MPWNQFGLASAGHDRPRRSGGSVLRAGAAGAVAGFGASLLLLQLTSTSPSSVVDGLSTVPHLLLALSLVYGGYWLLRCDFTTRSVGRIALWSVLGFVGLVAIAVWLVPPGTASPLELTLQVGTIGASTGMLGGLQSERRGRPGPAAGPLVGERADERFDVVNRLLRHHLLNGVAVIKGQAELLVEARSDPPAEAVTIRERSDELATLVRNVETIGRAASGDLPARPVDLESLLRGAVSRVRRDRAGATVETRIDPLPAVVANRRLAAAFESLLRATVDDADGPVAVSADPDGDEVEVAIAPAAARPSPAVDDEPVEVGEEDLGRFLAGTLVEYVGGRVDGSAGEGFVVRLRRAG